MVTYACHPEGEGSWQTLTARARALKLQKPHFLAMTTSEGVLPVTVAALKILRRGGSVSIIADLRDVHVPTSLAGKEGITDLEWRESWLSFLESHLIPFHHADPTEVVDPTTVERTSAIRSYRNGIAALEAAVAAHQRPIKSPVTYVCGRPPYGYKVVDQELVIDPDQAETIKTIFKAIHAGHSIGQVVGDVQARDMTLQVEEARGIYKTIKGVDTLTGAVEAMGYPAGSPAVARVFKGIQAGKGLRSVLRDIRVQEKAAPTGEFWDRTKIARILAHAPLYCTGAYKVRGTLVPLSHLAFLPAKWAPIPSAGGPGTMAARS